MPACTRRSLRRRFAGFSGDSERFLLGSREQAGDSDIDVYSAQSPLGAAVLGRRIGEEVSYDLPNGNTLTVKIADATPYTG